MEQSSQDKGPDASTDGNEPSVSGTSSNNKHAGDEHPVVERKLAEMLRKLRESELVREITGRANETATLKEAIQVCLDEICAYTGWPVGHAYMPAMDGTGELKSTFIWHIDDTENYENFRRVTESTQYAPDQGLPSRVMAKVAPQWMVGDTRYQHFPQANARIEAGLNSGFAFPAITEKSAVAVLEFFSPDVIEPDPQFLSVTTEIGILIGQVVKRKQAEQELKERELALTDSELRYRQLAELSPDAMFVHVDGEIVFANASAAKILSYPSPDDFIGKQAMDIVAPESRAGVIELRSRIMKGESSEIQVAQFLRSDGSCVLAERTGALVSWEGKPAILVLLRDVSALKYAERALIESEAHLRTIVDHSPAAIFLKDINGSFISANQVWHDTYNPKGGEITGKTVHDFAPQKIADDAAVIDARVLETGQPVIEEQYLQSSVGKRQHILSTKFPVRDDDGNIIAIGGVNTDITDRVMAERALRDSEAHLAHAQRIARLGSWTWDLDEDKVTWTDSLYRLMQIDRETATNPIDAFFARIHPDDRALVTEIRKGLIQAGNQQLMAFRIVLPNGEERHFHTQWELERDASERPVRAIGTTQDVTEVRQSEIALRESQQWLRAVVDNVPATLTLKNPDGTFRYVNKQFCEWYDLSPEQVVGKIGHDIFPDETADAVDASDRTIFESGESIQAEVPATFADGSKHTLLTNSFLVRSNDGSVIGKGLVGYDVTEDRRTAEMLRQAQKMEAVGQLTGGVAHDFNNLLAVVIGNLEMVTDHFADTSQVDTPVFGFVRNAFNAAEKGASLTHHLLAFSRQQVLRPEETDLAKLIAGTRDLMSVSMGEKITMELKTDDDLWLCKVDQAQLQNAILNMSINARDAMPSGGNVTISAENVRLDAERAGNLELETGDYVCLSVSDNGLGIREDALEHVFEPFFTTKDVGEGSGLGMSMVYGFVQQSGGAINIESAEGEGTSVKLYFPAIASATETVIEDVSKPLNEQQRADATILLVEDNASFREITRTILESLNFRVIEFGSAEEALAVIGDATPFDLLLSDIGLPGEMNGHDLAEYATSARPGLKTLLMSAHADRAFGGSVIDSNVSAFLPKPHRKVELAQTLRRLLELDRQAT